MATSLILYQMTVQPVVSAGDFTREYVDQMLVHLGVDPSSCLFSFWLFILPLSMFIRLHCILCELYFLYTGFGWTVWILDFFVGGMFHEVKGLISKVELHRH